MKAKAPLTDRQRRILEYIDSRITDAGRAPTVREIGERFGISSTNGVRTHLTALVRKGYVKKSEHVSRGLELTRPRAGQSRRVSIVGAVPAGQPIDAIENVEGEIVMDATLLPRGESFSLKVTGDSMKNAGIFDGDIVLVRKQGEAENGDIVVAIINGEATVKRFFRDGQQIRLQPENDAFVPIVLSRRSGDVNIAGRVVGLVRRF